MAQTIRLEAAGHAHRVARRIEAIQHESVLAVQEVGLLGPAATEEVAANAAATAGHQTDSDQCEGTKKDAFHEFSWPTEIRILMTKLDFRVTRNADGTPTCRRNESQKSVN